MQIYYFTRTGRSRKIAEELAANYNTLAREIEDGKNWRGPVGYLKAGYAAVSKQDEHVHYEIPDEGEDIAVIFPIWAGTFPPAVRTFVDQLGRENIIAVPTSLGSTLKDREGFIKIIDLVGKEITAPGKL